MEEIASTIEPEYQQHIRNVRSYQLFLRKIRDQGFKDIQGLKWLEMIFEVSDLLLLNHVYPVIKDFWVINWDHPYKDSDGFSLLGSSFPQRVLTAPSGLAPEHRRLLCRTAAVQQGPRGPGLIGSLQGLLVARLGVPWSSAANQGPLVNPWEVAKAKYQPDEHPLKQGESGCYCCILLLSPIKGPIVNSCLSYINYGQLWVINWC